MFRLGSRTLSALGGKLARNTTIVTDCTATAAVAAHVLLSQSTLIFPLSLPLTKLSLGGLKGRYTLVQVMTTDESTQ